MTTLLLALITIFSRLSLLAIGGVNSTLAEIARQTITIHHWLTPSQFAQLFAIANAAPGPNVLISTIIGAHMAGIAGGITATLAMILPSGILVIIVSKLWDRYRNAPLLQLIQAAILPITAGLILATAAVLMRQADNNWLTLLITLICGALTWRSRLHPLWLLGCGTMLGLVFIR